MKKLLIIVLLSFVLLTTGCQDKLIFEYQDNVDVNIFDEVYNTDYVKNIENGTLITEKEKIDTSMLGVVEIKLIVKDNKEKENEYKIHINVVDKEDPVIIFKDKLETDAGTKIDLLKDVEVTDNSKEEITAEVEGDYDFNKEGEYKLYYVAKDSSGNIKKEEFTMIVNKKKEVQPTPQPQPQPKTNNNTKSTKNFNIEVKNGVTYIDGVMIVNKTYSVPRSFYPENAVKCNNGQILNSATCNAAKEMINAAKQDGIALHVQSGFRSYDTQNGMWTRRKNQYGIEFADSGTARAGHSEHHTGLGFDMCGTESGCITSEYYKTASAKWMAKNAYKFGLILRYPNGKTNETGYKYESWHFRYVGKELAQKLYNNGDWITLENYFGVTSQYAN